jgi:hypothetical protein
LRPFRPIWAKAVNSPPFLPVEIACTEANKLQNTFEKARCTRTSSVGWSKTRECDKEMQFLPSDLIGKIVGSTKSGFGGVTKSMATTLANSDTYWTTKIAEEMGIHFSSMHELYLQLKANTQPSLGWSVSRQVLVVGPERYRWICLHIKTIRKGVSDRIDINFPLRPLMIETFPEFVSHLEQEHIGREVSLLHYDVMAKVNTNSDVTLDMRDAVGVEIEYVIPRSEFLRVFREIIQYMQVEGMTATKAKSIGRFTGGSFFFSNTVLTTGVMLTGHEFDGLHAQNDSNY